MSLRVDPKFVNQIRSQIAEHKRQLEKLQTLEALVSELMEEAETTSHEPATGQPPQAMPSENLSIGDLPITILTGKPRWNDVIAAILRQSGRPLTTKEIIERVKAAGQDRGMERNILYNSVYTTLKRNHTQFTRNDFDKWLLQSK
jgi:hypothetical protein